MKIAEVKLTLFKANIYTGWDKDGHGHPCRERKGVFSLLSIRTDDNIVGEYTFATSRPIPNTRYNPDLLPICPDSQGTGNIRGAIDKLRPVLIGEDPRCRERIHVKISRMQRLVPDITDQVIALVDLTLWDLMGKLTGMPVFRLLGGHRTKIRAYGSIMVGDTIPGGLSTPEDYGSFSKELINRGYQAIKLHTWMDENWHDGAYSGQPDPHKDVSACHAVREAVGPNKDLMLDAFHNYHRYDALYIGRELEKLNFRWIEEPMNEYSLTSYKWLCDNLSIPVCGPETMCGKLATRAEWIREGASDIIRAGVKDVGGLTPLIKIINLCEAYNLPMDLHGPDAGNLHMLSAMNIPGDYLERGLLHPFLDYDALPPWFNTPYETMDEDGYVPLFEKPGFGFDFNYDYIQNNLEQ